MARGDVFRMRPVAYRDERTGRRVWRLTSWDDANCVAAYFYFQSLSRDERYLVFASDRSGSFELYRLEIGSGETMQLTHDPRCDIVRFNVHPEGKEVFYTVRKGVYAVDLESGEERVVAEIEGRPWDRVYGGPSISGDGRIIVCLYRRGGRYGIAMAEAEGSRFESVYECNKRLSHVQVNPGNSSIISFVPLPDRQNDPGLPPTERARAWRLDVDTGAAEPFLVAPPGFRATHEYWGPSGDRLYFHLKTVPSWTPASIAFITLDGNEIRTLFSSNKKRLGHSCVDAEEKVVVTDVQEPRINELIAVYLENGASETLCWPNSSVRDQVTGHVHPSFSPSGRKVVYTSDATGKAQVYMVSLYE